VTREGPRDHGEARAGRRAHEQPLASRRTEKSQRRHVRSTIGGQCRCTAPCRARGLSKRIEAQGGRGGHAVGRGTRHVSMHCLFLLPKTKRGSRGRAALAHTTKACIPALLLPLSYSSSHSFYLHSSSFFSFFCSMGDSNKWEILC
jgi:hypothetical protein